MDYAEFLRKFPKVELHCHLEGSVRPTTAIELARAHDVRLPSDDPEKLYDYDNLVDFLAVYVPISQSIVSREEFARVAFESLEDGVKLGNLRYREMFFNPTNHYPFGADYESAADGVIDGIRRAEETYGVRCRMIVAINKYDGPGAAVELVQQVLDHPRDEMIGIGSDHLAPDNREQPGMFAEAYRLARSVGLHVTAHAGEIDSSLPADVLEALDELGCERIDHGYHVVDDPEAVKRVRDEAVPFTCCPHSSERLSGWTDYLAHPVKQMIDAGLRVTFNTDDPPMFQTDIGWEYEDTCPRMELPVDDAIQIAMTGVEATWLDADERGRLRADFEAEIAELRGELESG
jgi:adenosine deaminase